MGREDSMERRPIGRSDQDTSKLSKYMSIRDQGGGSDGPLNCESVFV